MAALAVPGSGLRVALPSPPQFGWLTPSKYAQRAAHLGRPVILYYNYSDETISTSNRQLLVDITIWINSEASPTMKRRLNIKFFLIPLGCLVPLVAGIHAVPPGVQVGRSADLLEQRAERAEQAGDLDEAEKYWKRFLGYEPGDVDALTSYGLLLERRADSRDEWLQALSAVEGRSGTNPIASRSGASWPSWRSTSNVTPTPRTTSGSSIPTGSCVPGRGRRTPGPGPLPRGRRPLSA